MQLLPHPAPRLPAHRPSDPAPPCPGKAPPPGGRDTPASRARV